MRLSQNFTLDELVKSQTALRRGIDNTPDETAIEGLQALVRHVLQPARNILGRPLRVNSGYRSAELNRAVGGSRTSDHCKGWAADIEVVPDRPKYMWDLGRTLQLEVADFKQLIWEFGGAWIHVSFDPSGKTNRRQVLEAFNDDGKTRYRPFTFRA